MSKREWDVVRLLLQGKSNKLIAASLCISDRTVEFHLKNIYAKFQVRTRIELVLILGNTTGRKEIGKLGYSTVDDMGESAENRGTLHSRTDRPASFRDILFMIGKDLEMKNLLKSKHALAGVIAALFTGFVWVSMMKRYGHMSTGSLMPWIVPLVLVLTVIGLSVGLIGKRNGNTLRKVCLSTLVGTGLSPFAFFPVLLTRGSSQLQ